MDELMFSLCCAWNRGLLCGSKRNCKELHLDGVMLSGCKFIVMKFCLMNIEKALRFVLAITHVYVKFDILCNKIYSTKRYRWL